MTAGPISAVAKRRSLSSLPSWAPGHKPPRSLANSRVLSELPSPSPSHRRAITTGRLLPSGARLATQSDPSAHGSKSRRPLSFPLGTGIGFLLGFSVAGLIGYARLIEWHSRADAGMQDGLSQLETRVHEIKTSLAQLDSVAQYQQRSKEAQETTARIRAELSDATRAHQRVEQRVVGLEEDNIALRQRILKLERPSPKARQGVLWTGRSRPDERIV